MKLRLLTFALLLTTSLGISQSVGIGTTSPDASAMLDITSMDKGLLIPRTDTSMVSNPANGLMIFSNADKAFYYYKGTSWQKIEESLWERVGQTDTIIYKGNFPVAQVQNGLGEKTEINGGFVEMSDTNGNQGYYSNKSLGFTNIDDKTIPGFFFIQLYNHLNKDELMFYRVLDSLQNYNESIYGRDSMFLISLEGNKTAESRITSNQYVINETDASLTETMSLDPDGVDFKRTSAFSSGQTKVGLDSLYMTSQVGLLLPEAATLKPSELFFDSQFSKSLLSSNGFTVKEAISSTDVFDRIGLYPDDFIMYNAAKWKTSRLGKNTDNNSGEFQLFDGTGNNTLTHIGASTGNPFLELSSNNNLKVGLWGFDDYGIINTLAGNGSINTYIGTAQKHNNTSFGGMGVMDDLGFVKAGMEVTESGLGNIYSEGHFKVVDDIDQELVLIGRDLNVLGGAGFVMANDTNGVINFLAGSNLSFDGNAHSGFAAVHDDNGIAKAGLAVTSDDKGQLFADALNIGKSPNAGNLYPLHLVETSNYGLNIEKEGGSNRWELYVSNSGGLELYLNNGIKGSFDPVTGAYTAASDGRLKSNIRSLSKVLPTFKNLNPTKYSFITENPTNQTSYGLIAQELKEVFPELVRVNSVEKSEGTMSIDYSGLTVVAIKAIQEQQQVIESQNAELLLYKTQLDRQNERLQKLEEILLNK